MAEIEQAMGVTAAIFLDHYKPHTDAISALINEAKAARVSIGWKEIGNDTRTRFDPSDGVVSVDRNYGKPNDKIRIRWNPFDQKIDYFFDRYNRRFNEPLIDDSIHIRMACRASTDLIIERIQRRVSRKDRISNGALFDRMALIGTDLFACDTLFNSVGESGPTTRGHRLFPSIDMTKWRRWDEPPTYAEYLAPDEKLICVGNGTPMISRPTSGYMTSHCSVPRWMRELIRMPVH